MASDEVKVGPGVGLIDSIEELAGYTWLGVEESWSSIDV